MASCCSGQLLMLHWTIGSASHVSIIEFQSNVWQTNCAADKLCMFLWSVFLANGFWFNFVVLFIFGSFQFAGVIDIQPRECFIMHFLVFCFALCFDQHFLWFITFNAQIFQTFDSKCQLLVGKYQLHGLCQQCQQWPLLGGFCQVFCYNCLFLSDQLDIICL